MIKSKRNLIICAFALMLLCCFSAVSANEDIDDSIAVSDDIAVDGVAEVDSVDDLSSVQEYGNEMVSISDDNITWGDDENLGQSNDDESLGSYSEVDWSDCDEVTVDEITYDTFQNSNTIYIFNGEYEINEGFEINGENILLKSNDGSHSNLIFNMEATLLSFSVNNLALENLKFTYAEDEGVINSIFDISSSNNVLFKNCVFDGGICEGYLTFSDSQDIKFVNCTFNSLQSSPLIYIMMSNCVEFIDCSFENMLNYNEELGQDPEMNAIFCFQETDVVFLKNCNFTNCNMEKFFKWEYGSGLINITECNFKNNPVLKFIPDDVESSHIEVYLENNTFDCDYAISLNSADLVSKAYLHVLNNETFGVGEKCDVNVVLVDDVGNRIYSPDLKVFGKKPSFSSTGIYTIQYTPTSAGNIPVVCECSNIADLNSSDAYLKVRESFEITLNYSNIFYGGVFNVNATLKDDISNENVTFIIINFKGVVVDSKDVNVMAGFAGATFENLSAGDYYVNVTYAGNDYYLDSIARESFKVFKVNQTMELSTELSIYVNDDVVIKAVLSNSTDGNVTFRLGENKEIIPVSDKIAETTFSGLTQADTYTIFATYSGDNNYNPCEKNITITVMERITPFLNILNTEIIPGKDIIVTIVMNEEINDNVTVTVNNNPETMKLVNGTVNLTLSKVKANEVYTIDVGYAGFGKFNPTSNSTTLTVNKLNTPISASADPIKVGQNAKVIVYVDSEATGFILVDGQYSGIIDGGNANITIPGLSNGTYIFDVVYSGDEDKFNGNQTTVTVVVEKIETSITVNVDDIELGQVASISVGNLPAGATGNLTFSNIGLDPVTLGVGETYKVSNLVNGTYNVFVTYSGDGKYAGSSANKTFTVKYVEMVDETAISGINSLSTGNNVVGIKLPSNATGTLTVIVDGTSVNATLVNGVANIPLSGLSAGKHNITVIYSGDGNYSGYTSSQIVEVAKIIPKATVSAPSKITSGKSATVKINLPSDATGYVVVEVQGKKYDNIKVVNGVAAVNIAGLKAGNPVLKYTYKGNAKYASVSGSVKLKVVDPKVTVTLKKIKVKKSAKKLVLQSTVKIDGKTKKGLKVTFKFNGKKYTAKTTAKGVAKITIKKSVLKKLKVGKKVTYTATYGKKTAKVTVKVKK